MEAQSARACCLLPKLLPKALLVLAGQTLRCERDSPRDILCWAKDTHQAGVDSAPAAEHLRSYKANASTGLIQSPKMLGKNVKTEGSKVMFKEAPLITPG